MVKGASILVLAWLAVASATPAQAGPDGDNKSVVVATSHFPPFHIVDGDKISGVDTEIVKLVFKRMGYSVDMQAYPWSRTYKLALTGRITAIFSFTKSKEREEHFYFSAPINSVKDVLFKKKTRDIKWTKLEDLKGLTVGVSQGYSYAPEFMKLLESGTVKVDYAAGKAPELIHLRKLAKDRLDLFICEASVCSHLIKSQHKQFGDIHFINRIVGPVRTFHVGFAKSDPRSKTLQKEFDKVLQTMAASGELEKMYRRYGIVDVPESTQ